MVNPSLERFLISNQNLKSLHLKSLQCFIDWFIASWRPFGTIHWSFWGLGSC